jgi:hypothetical protein
MELDLRSNEKLEREHEITRKYKLALNICKILRIQFKPLYFIIHIYNQKIWANLKVYSTRHCRNQDFLLGGPKRLRGLKNLI